MNAVAGAGAGLEFRQLLPEARSVEVGELLGSLELVHLAPKERPYTLVNFIATVDGRAAFEGRSAPLGDEGDRAMFHGLREHVDAVFAGTRTMRAERYGRLVRDPERRARRARAGLRPDPIACLITRSGEVPTEIPLFSDPDSQVVVFTPAELDCSHCAADVRVVRVEAAELSLPIAMRLLRAEHGVRTLLCEGGPTVFGALVRERLVDELFLTLAPKLTGGGADPTLTSGPGLDAPAALQLVWALERAGSLFLRYALS